MERQIIFRDFQEQQSADHNDMQTFGRRSLDSVVKDAVTAARRFAGFAVVKSAQAEITVAPGRMYGPSDVQTETGTAVYARNSAVVQSVVQFLPAAAKRIVSISASGVENETDIAERDFLVNVETGQTEPDAVPMVRSRDAVISFTQGSEAADPQPPALPVTHVEIARVLLDNLQVVSVTMMEANKVVSTDALDHRTDGLEDFRDRIGPRVDSLASDLAALANALKTKGQARAITQLYQDVARLKDIARLPDDASDYGADRFLVTDESDITNSASLGYDALVEEGLRFPAANEDEFELDIFSANDPNAAKQGGLLLPAYDHELKLAIDTFDSDLGMAQYGFQSIDIVQRSMSRQRLRYGSIFTSCSNSAWWQSGTYDSAAGTFAKDGETFEVLDFDRHTADGQHVWIRMRQVWVDSYQEPYWDYVKTDFAIVGAQVAQSFLCANDTWMTKFGFYLTVKAANEAVHVTIAEVISGVPDLEKAVLHQTVPHGDLEVNGWTEVACMPTFLKSGKRYAMVLTSNANHKVGLASGQRYLDGTFFFSTDGAYYIGDLTKDMMLRIYGARFRAPQVTIELEAINLDGGIRTIDILAPMIVPASTNLVFEVQPGGSGAWIALTSDDLTAFASTPPLAHFRVRFVGTRDIMPGLMLTGSRAKIARPKVAFKHVSTLITLAAASDNITVIYTLEGFDETPHDFAVLLRQGATNETADTISTKALPDLPNVGGRWERTFNYQLGAPITTFRLIADGATNSAGNTFHAAERVHFAQ
jgi:hypothetical protein